MGFLSRRDIWKLAGTFFAAPRLVAERLVAPAALGATLEALSFMAPASAAAPPIPPSSPQTLRGLGLPTSAAQMAFGGNGALRSNLPYTNPPVNSTPTITLGSAQPGSTPTAIGGSASGVPNVKNFLLSGGTYVRPNATSPYTTAVTIQQFPNSTLGFGSAYVDFLSDAPTLTFQHLRLATPISRIIVDGVEALRVVQGIRANTALLGGASTITLDAGASATNGQYFNNWIHITGGTGAGQYGQVKSYVGATKIATMVAPWATQPDATSTFEITDSKAQFSNLTATGQSIYYLTLDWSGERRMRHYRVEHSGQPFFGVNVTSTIDSVEPAPKFTGARLPWFGDSFSAGTGADLGALGSLAKIAADLLGCELIDGSIGGTGYLNAGTSYPMPTRMIPPANAWFVQINDSSAGSYTVTQNSLTATINFNDSMATIQAMMGSTFGTNAFTVIKGTAATQSNTWFVGNGANASFSGAMTANFAGLTGASGPLISQYLGDLAPNIPTDGSGKLLPFSIALASGHNDTTDTNAGFTPALVQSTVTALIQQLGSLYPQAQIYVTGNMYLPANPDAAVTNCNAAILAACQAALPLINGKLPFIDSLTTNWFSGTGHVGALAGNGNCDVCVWTDGVHPSGQGGHVVYGQRFAQAIQALNGL